MADHITTTGYRIRTIRLILECPHPEWMKENQKLYHELQLFYHKVLTDHPELHEYGSQNLMRELERLTVSSKSNPEPEIPLPWNKVPAYFRRAAINGEIAALKSLLAKNGDIKDEKFPERSAAQNSVVLYQRLYRNFTGRRITVNIWNGREWIWEECRLHGNELPDMEKEGVRWLSPSIVISRNHYFLHVPVREPVYDARKLKQRITDRANICAIQFTNRDAFAVACILNAEGDQLSVRYFKGGAQYRSQSSRWLDYIRKSQMSMGSHGQPKADQKYWMHLKNLNEYWAHKISRDILNYAIEYQAKVITWEEYEPEYSKAVLKQAGNWSPLHLSSRIKKYLTYKSWGSGILVAAIKTFQIKNRTFTAGDKDLQRARIIGKQFMNNFDKQV